MAQGKLELLLGLTLIVGVASYGWMYHHDNDASVTSSVTETVVNEITTLSGLKVNQSEFTPTAMSEPYKHLTINGETWFTQTANGFESTQTLVEIPAIPEDAWYSAKSLAAFFDLSATWDKVVSYIKSYFPESE